MNATTNGTYSIEDGRGNASHTGMTYESAKLLAQAEANGLDATRYVVRENAMYAPEAVEPE